MDGTHDNDNSDPWCSIGLQAALIVNKLRLQAQLTNSNEQKNEDRKCEPDPGSGDEQKRAEQREYVEQRLRELAAFERRVGGNKN